MKFRGILIALFAMLAIAAPARAQDADSARAGVEAAMADTAAGWNSGDIDRFLGVYSADPETAFVGDGVALGVDTIRQRYLKNYPDRFAGAAAADGQQLSFTIEQFRMLGPDHALLIARWHLSAAGELAAANGLTTLVFHREADGWKIIADHSS